MKKFLRKCLRYFGYDFMKVPAAPILKKDKNVMVGNYEIVLPANNPLISTYKEQKDFNGEIARLVNIVNEKYPDLVLLDVGANVGDTVAIIKSIKDIPIVCIEGDELSYRYLQRNVAQFKHVTTIKQFLGETDSSINVTLDKQGWNTTIIPGKEGASLVQLLTLDTVINDIPDKSKIKFLKIDTEGFDTIILRGAFNYLKQVKPVVYFEYNRDNMNAIGEDGLSTIFSLASLGYSDILFFDDRGRFVISASLSNEDIVSQLHHYANGSGSLIYYYNICLFHKEDETLAKKITENELLAK
ncbi:FkbM family methyltransferase [Foetidibacter luteolus]|uniref:FkbM family methyltransferase n=1 Tax=Foetidibacter luteolus TaxID=2608880 RepID=UPI00129A5AC4|nr:FkbM family methyltransferase [Foetidibacter luteolus]